MFKAFKQLPVWGVVSISLAGPVYADVTVAPGEEYINNYALDIFDFVENLGHIINQGDINLFANTYYNNAGITDNYGWVRIEDQAGLTSSGAWNNYGNLSVWGDFSNSGQFYNDISGHVYFYQNSQLLNESSFINDGDAQIESAVINNGLIQNNRSMHIVGSLLNTSQIENTFSATLGLEGQLTNNGDLTNYGTMLFVAFPDDTTGYDAFSSLINNGTINHYGEFTSNYSRTAGLTLENAGIFNNFGSFDGVNGVLQIHNSGTFNSQAALVFEAIAQPYVEIYDEIVNDGVFINSGGISNLRRMENSNDFQNRNGLLISGYFYNRPTGTFDNTAGINAYGLVQNEGLFINSGELVMEGDAELGVVAPYTIEGVLNNSGTFQNTGTISEGYAYRLQGLRIVNSGMFHHDGQINPLTSFQLDNSGTFNNNSGIVLDQYITGSRLINNSGVLNSSAFIIGIDALDNSGEFNNTADAYFGQLSNQTGGVINNIDDGYFHANMYVYNRLDNSGEFNNQAGLYLGTDNGTVVDVYNAGVINNSRNASFGINSYSYDVQLNLYNTNLFNNEGYIDGYSLVLDNSGVFNNSGYIRGVQVSINNSGQFNNNSNLNEFYNPAVLQIDNAGSFVNNAGIFNVNLLRNTGQFDNLGRIEITTGSLINESSGVFNLGNGGVNFLEEINVSGVIDNRGEFNNYGTVWLHDYGDSVNGYTISRIINSGVYNNTEFASIRGDGGPASIENSGIFNYTGMIENASIVNTGEFNSGNVNNDRVALNLNDGAFFDNRGVWNNWALVSGLGSLQVQLLNTGIINNHVGVSNLNAENAGVFNNSGNGFVQVSAGNRFVNQVGGVFNNGNSATSVPSYVVIGIDGSGVFENHGTLNNALGANINMVYGSTIENAGTLNNRGQINGSGTINNSGTIVNEFDGFIPGLDTVNSTGVLENNGVLMANTININGGVLRGNEGVIYSDIHVTEAGTIAPGLSTGYMALVGTLTLDGTLEIEFDPTVSNGYLHDILDISGALILGETSTLDISFLGDMSLTVGDHFDVAYFDSIIGEFADFFYDPILSDGLALAWSVSNDHWLSVDVVSAVPLPAAFWLFLSGVAGLVITGRRRSIH